MPIGPPVVQRALWKWTGGRWALQHKGPQEKETPPDRPGEVEGETYDTEHQRSQDDATFDEDEGEDWVVMPSVGQHQNCTDFAFEGKDDLVLEPDLAKLLVAASNHGYRQVANPAEATVVLYGSGANYNHAIRLVNGEWQEVNGMGGEQRRYTKGRQPPAQHGADVIVGTLKKG